MLHALIFKTRAKCRGVSHLESPNTSRKHFFTNAEGRHVHSFTLNGKVKEREAQRLERSIFRVTEILFLSMIRERIVHFLRHSEIKSKVWQPGCPFQCLNMCIKRMTAIHSG